MTYSHFVVCAILTYLPPFVIYRAKNLKDTETPPNVMLGVIFYALSQIAKLLFFATFLGENSGNKLLWTQEILKALFHSLDILFLYFLYTLKLLRGNEKESKILSVGIGWYVGESVISRLIPLWIGATDYEFTWKWIQLSILSNIHLLLYISLSCLIFLYTHKKAESSLLSNLRIAMIFYLSVFFVYEVSGHFITDEWVHLGVHFGMSLLFGLILIYLNRSFEKSK